MASRHVEVLWHCAELASSEHCSVSFGAEGSLFLGTVVLPIGDQPAQIQYTIRTDSAGRTLSAEAQISTLQENRRLVLAADEHQRWTLNDVPVDALDGCVDVDLGWTPATNTLPIRRLGLAVGETATIVAAWVRFPELDVVPSRQTYTRLAADRWRFEDDGFDYELAVDTDTGIVRRYGTDLWSAAAFQST